MGTSLNDRKANALSDMAYIAEKLGQLDGIKNRENIGKIFYDENGTIRTEFKDAQGNEISGLKEYAQKINENREKYSDVLNSKLLGTTDDATGYKGIAVKNSDGSVTVASAGTDSAMDIVSDIQIAIGKIPDQQESAKNFVEKLKDNKDANGNPIISTSTPVDFTGHSFGATLKELLATYFINSMNVRTVKAFESCGAKGIIDNNPELANKYYANKTLIDSIVKSYVSEFDPVVNWDNHIGTIINAFSKDGTYIQHSITEGGFFYHKLDRYELLVYDSDGNIIQGQINNKNLLEAIQNDPANLANYLAINDAVKGFGSGMQNSLDKFVSDCTVFGNPFAITQTSATLNFIMSLISQYKTTKTTFIDPIAVDLDNDGIETTDIAGGVNFDLDGNGTKEKSSWVKADDGLVVMDRNENGTIDSGKELFGDQTIIKDADGNLKTASTGFDALSEIDSNGDKVIDSSDENFNKLKIWQDKNQDGISQSNELQNLDSAGIKKIDINYLTVNTDDGHGNTQTRTSGIEFADGRTGVVGEFLFKRNTIDTQNSDFSNVSKDVLFMPYLRGFGEVTDLYHAMSNDSALKILMQEFVNIGQQTKDQRLQPGENSLQSTVYSLQPSLNSSIGSTNLTNSTNQEPGTTSVQISEILNQKFESLLFRWCGVDTIDVNSRGSNIDARKLAVLEKIFTEKFEGFGEIGKGIRSANPNTVAAAQLNTFYNNIKDRFFANMLLQSHLKEYVTLGAIELSENGEIKVNEQVADVILNFQKKAIVYRPETVNDEIAIPQTVNDPLFSLKFYALANTVKAISSAAEKEEFVNYFIGKGEGIYANELRGILPNLILGSKAGDTITGDNSNNKIYGFEGNDELHGGKGNDVLVGGKGDDYIEDYFDSDTYVYRRGDGNDTIVDHNDVGEGGWTYDKLKLEEIVPSDIKSIVKDNYDLILTFKEVNNNPAEKITFKDWFVGDFGDGHHNLKMEEIEFADGTKWNTAKIEANIIIYGTEKNDELSGSLVNDTVFAGNGNDKINSNNGNDTIFAENGDDIVNAGDGNDTISGGDGNDTIFGDNSNNYANVNVRGNDILNGGKGDDYMNGGFGNDTYIYRKGDGNDTIYDHSDVGYGGWSYDKLKLIDLTPSDILSTIKANNDFILTFKDVNGNPGEKITFKDWFVGDFGDGHHNFKMEEIEFADGTKWNTADIERFYKHKITGTDGVDNIGEKNDHGMVVEGKKGNDTISGGAKEDVYVVNHGDGNDVIKTTGGGEDTIRINASSDSLSFKKMNTNDMVTLMRSLNGSASLTLAGYLDQQKHETEKIKQIETMSDGAILTEKKLQLLIQAIAAFETEKGISWEKAVEQNDPKTKEILSQHWSYEKKAEE